MEVQDVGAAGSLVAIDVGGTTIKGARLDEGGLLQQRLTVPTPVSAGPESVVSAVAGVARALLVPGSAVVGVSMPGVLDVGAGVVRYAANLGLRDVALQRLLREQLATPVVLQHDVRAACQAEARLGAGVGVADFVEVVLGTGLAAGTVVAGELLTGSGGAAGELGHLPVVPDGEPCACGGRGCTEVYASAGGVARRYADAGGARGTDAAGVVAALGTDVVADRVWSDAVLVLARALAAAVVLTDPSLVVLAGGLSGAGAVLSAPLVEHLRDLLPWREPPAVVCSPLGADAGLWGAALTAAGAAGWDTTSASRPGWGPLAGRVEAPRRSTEQLAVALGRAEDR